MLSMVSRIIITTYLTLIPPKALLSTYLKYTVVQMAGYGIIAAGHFLPLFAAPLFHLGMLVFGVGRGIFTFPYLILVRTFNRPSDAFAVLLWMAMGMAGNNWGILFQTLMEDALQWPWYATISVFSVANLFLAIVAYILIPEEYLPEEQTQVCEYASNMASIIKVYYGRRTSNWLNLLEYIFLENQLFILVFWTA